MKEVNDVCTSLKYKHCMGRNYDYEQSFEETVVVVPEKLYDNEYSIMGICTGSVDEFPLLYDGMNEKGLCASGLAFEGNAFYMDDNDVGYGTSIIFPYQFILHILGNFGSVEEVREYLCFDNVVFVDEQYSPDLPNADLHWLICDENESIVVESTEDGLNVYDGEVLTNNPQYPDQTMMSLWSNDFVGKNIPLNYDNTRGTETYNLKGDYTSQGRFSRVSYLKKMLEKAENDFDDVTQTFHLLASVEQIYGLTPVNGKYEYTIYSVVYDMANKKMHIKTYDNNYVFTIKSFDYYVRYGLS